MKTDPFQWEDIILVSLRPRQKNVFYIALLSSDDNFDLLRKSKFPADWENYQPTKKLTHLRNEFADAVDGFDHSFVFNRKAEAHVALGAEFESGDDCDEKLLE